MTYHGIDIGNMELKTGSDRRVVVGDRLTIKIARSNPMNFIKSVRHIGQNYGVRGIARMWRAADVDGYTGLKWQLFHGVKANRRERSLAKHTAVVVPTLSLLGGVINVQPTVDDVKVQYSDIIRAFADNLDNPGMNLPRLGHTVEDIGNFGVHDGLVKFRDAGSYGLERVIELGGGVKPVAESLGALSVVHSSGYEQELQ